MLIEPGASQDRLHYRVREQIVEARPVTAAIETLVHDLPPCSSILCTIDAKHDRFMSLDRKFRGISRYLRLFSHSDRAQAARLGRVFRDAFFTAHPQRHSGDGKGC